ncbi:putative 2-oxoglutarate ferredoxin oxidoreductase subunit gamma [delta proteobacterium NaphS2]|nr:putative 2-oxoglutarate ferredoxin oxidoreductase subunit gamma [delta proteobacterium NaphS2]
MDKRIVFSGSGGQGVITAAIILAEAAAVYESNLNAVQTQSYGPEARGGATRADVIISEAPIHHPKVINPSILICLTQTAYNKYAGILRPGGLMLTDSKFVKIDFNVDARQVELDIYQVVMEKIGKPIVFNICMLGALLELTGLVKPDSVLKVLKDKIAPDFMAMNEKALETGIRLARRITAN